MVPLAHGYLISFPGTAFTDEVKPAALMGNPMAFGLVDMHPTGYDLPKTSRQYCLSRVRSDPFCVAATYRPLSSSNRLRICKLPLGS